MTALAALAGVLAFGGLALAALSFRPVPVTERDRVLLPRVDSRARRRVVAAAAAFLAALVLTRWPVAAIAAAGAGWAAAEVGG